MQKSIEFNIDLNASDKDGWTAFHWACFNEDSKIAERLMQKSADINAKDEMGRTAFHWACNLGCKGIVEMMIDNAESFKLDLMAIDNDGKTGFQLASVSGQTDKQLCTANLQVVIFLVFIHVPVPFVLQLYL